jgi:2-keto-4-pentenoate hydratase/2-oxohepta-3-ene-1,7-dioic acid hydratase in catechol pathway
MKTFAYYDDANIPRIGIETESGVFDFSRIWEFFKDYKGLRQATALHFIQVMIENDYYSFQTFQEVLEIVADFRSLEDVRLREPIRYDVPVARPPKILCLGRNYRAHAEEWGSQVPDSPIVFSKLPSSLLPHRGQIEIPRGSGRIDHELELALVIGKKGKRISAEKATDYIAGYTIANDITARDRQLQDMKKSYPWTISKSYDTFCPCGPFLIPKDVINDPHQLNMELNVNGTTKQKANTRDMIFKIPEIIAYISYHITLNPGDIICTGTPEGTLPIVAGDRITAKIDHLGVLENPVVER